MVLIRFFTCIMFIFLSVNAVAANKPGKAQYILKFATLVPADTAWMTEVDRWADEVYEKSNGRLKFKMYPGGVMGDEPDVLRKIRSRQLQGALNCSVPVADMYCISKSIILLPQAWLMLLLL